MHQYDETDEPLFCTKTQAHHSLNFKCQCKRCVRLHTLTMQDREFLRSIGIAWQRPKKTTP